MTLTYKRRRFERTKGYMYDHFDVENGDEVCISGCKKGGGDRLYRSDLPVEIDEDARCAYWTEVRNLPKNVAKPTA